MVCTATLFFHRNTTSKIAIKIAATATIPTTSPVRFSGGGIRREVG